MIPKTPTQIVVFLELMYHVKIDFINISWIINTFYHLAQFPMFFIADNNSKTIDNKCIIF